ncbi:glycosyltransferase family 4 protein [Motiliproteus sp. MSK22-1]|uniref:MraY family glycosyltransferase n=1 Tax=Motiliproteus sp. MSK22-1 TaxID=1897630 RepID=UPI00097630A6|nr:glycosyltransferase family 4 protein [Motiliproteus sp. MSK22-1]OMH30901.1 glycosyl transferase [Motiliproteus sp. MSK22-1]
MNYWSLCIVCGAFSWFLTGLLHRYALAKNLLDVPNDRSSHSVPTPRGGGIAIVLTFIVGCGVLVVQEGASYREIFGLVGAGGIAALIGFIDDHRHIAARWRLIIHFFAAGWGLYWLGGMPPLMLFDIAFDLGWIGHLLTAVYLVWLLNLYNFMDGIDGLAGIEAITSGFGAGVVCWLVLSDPLSLAVFLPFLLVASVIGFLFWNFPPAKIFMGDGGSGFLGLVFGLLSLQAAWAAPKLFWCWIILLGVFLVDSTVTLIRRLLHGDKVYEAHCCHGYQYASRKLGGHKVISVSVGLINIFWLTPIASLVALDWLNALLGLILAYVPLFWLAAHFKSGAAHLQEV